MKKKIAVVGAGLMGCGIAQVFSLAGHPVGLRDSLPEALAAAPGRIRADLDLAVGAGLLTEVEAAAALGLISFHEDLAGAVADAVLVVECVPEKMELKQALFRELDQICPPPVVLASNTSVMSITQIASASTRRERVLGTHFFNPPFLLPLVEVVQTQETSPEAISLTMELMAGAGKKPIHIKKDVPGFVANRMQHALWREAFHILDEGIADAATIDEAVRSSFGLRLPVLGPMGNCDLIGLDLVLDIHQYIYPHLASEVEPSRVLRETIGEGKLGFKTGGRGLQNFTPEGMTRTREKLAKYLLAVAKKK
ncbi:MAG: 3-hydroxyacyl-CoA dehydrogenase family protein [Deltaproteobacteria bacterium]|jgi:3-hydroxybutyryl-CoA dehydrogenase|nr:3-hydroxyacyl-CoA dehydrogenase family protein [Deltaproteobacteria bacterium]